LTRATPRHPTRSGRATLRQGSLTGPSDEPHELNMPRLSREDPPPIKFTCTKCGTEYRRAHTFKGYTLKCHKCGTNLTVPDPGEFPASRAVESGPTAPKYLGKIENVHNGIRLQIIATILMVGSFLILWLLSRDGSAPNVWVVLSLLVLPTVPSVIGKAQCLSISQVSGAHGTISAALTLEVAGIACVEALSSFLEFAFAAFVLLTVVKYVSLLRSMKRELQKLMI